MAHGAFGYDINSERSSFTEALQKVVDIMSRIGIKKESVKPVILRTSGYNDKHIKAVSKQTGMSVGGVKKLIHNFNNAPIDYDYVNKFKEKKLKEETPTNSMGQSSSTTGPVKTVDPLLKRKPLKRLKAFLKI